MKLGITETGTPLRLKECKRERWFQTATARSGTIVIEARRMVYEVTAAFESYSGRGGSWGLGFRTFIVDAATGDVIIGITGGHLIESSVRPQSNLQR